MKNTTEQKILSEITGTEKRFALYRVAIILRIHDLMMLKGLKMKDLNIWVNANPDPTLKSILKLETELDGLIIRIVSPKKHRQDDTESTVLQ
jgi:hypothetical protein